MLCRQMRPEGAWPTTGLNSTLQDRFLESSYRTWVSFNEKTKKSEKIPGQAGMGQMGTLQSPKRKRREGGKEGGRERGALSQRAGCRRDGACRKVLESYTQPHPQEEKKSSHHATPTRLTSQPTAAPSQCALSTARHAWVTEKAMR